MFYTLFLVKRSKNRAFLLLLTEDVVYMEDPKQREEYVLNEKGRIWVGTINNNTGRPWNFAQVRNFIVPSA